MGVRRKPGQKSSKNAVRLSRQGPPKALNEHGIARDREMEQLRGELRRVIWELDFLKEAAGFLSKTSRSAIK